MKKKQKLRGKQERNHPHENEEKQAKKEADQRRKNEEKHPWNQHLFAICWWNKDRENGNKNLERIETRKESLPFLNAWKNKTCSAL